MTIPIICLIVKKNKQLGMAICGGLIAVCTALTFYVCYKHNVYWLNWNDQSMNVYYYTKSYLRGNVYYMGCLVSYMTMRGHKSNKKKPKK